MVKLRVAVRVVPEEAYLSSLETPVPRRSLPGERRFPIIVRDPEEWYIGRLAIDIASQYRNLYKQCAVALEILRIIVADTRTEKLAM